jgi:WD40 repeat protein
MALLAILVAALAVCSYKSDESNQQFPEWVRLRGHTLPVRTLTYSPESQKLASGGDDGSVIIWDLVSGTHQLLLGESGRTVRSIAFSPDGAALAALYGYDDPTVILWEVATGTELARLETRSFRATRLAFAPDGTTLAIGCRDAAIRLWDLASRKVTSTLSGHHGPITALRYAPDGRTLASGASVVWSSSGEPRAVRFGNEPVRSSTLGM